MLSKLNSLQYGTYGFRLKGSHQQRVVGIHSIGWEKQTDSSYDWNGLARIEKDIIIFQYTLKGSGNIKIEDETFQLKVGNAFLIKIPSNHRYYLPADSSEWEFVHITLFGDEALRCYKNIVENLGHIFSLNVNSTPISLIVDILKIISTNKMNDAYESSAFAYSFLMELHRYILNIKTNDEWPDSISNAITFIENNYQNSIGLDNIVEASGLSKYHFTRLFHTTIHTTPVHYLTNIRINKSIDLLKNDKLTIEDIALKVGFSNGNYFGKVFRASLGVPPGEYRNTKAFITVDHHIGDY